MVDESLSPLLYVQSSFDWMHATAINPNEINNALLDIVGSDGTLVMPSFPRLRDIDSYMAEFPTFDVRRTPTQAGLIAEQFRRMPETIRSLHPWASVAARGPLAQWIVAEHHRDVNPFGPNSPFSRMLEKDIIVIGLGVSLNTFAFIHVLDDRLRDTLPFPLYAPSPRVGRVIDDSRRAHDVQTLCLRSEIMTNIKPSNAISELKMPPTLIRIGQAGGAQVFSLRARPFLECCRKLAETALAEGLIPCWHRQTQRP